MFLEILIAIALISIVFITLLGIGVLVLNISGSIQKETKADTLIKEEFEAVRNFRDGTKWTVNGLGTALTGSSNPYHLANISNKWTLVSGEETIGIYSRKVVFDKVSRNSSFNIEEIYNPSNDNVDTRKVTITVSWQGKTLRGVAYFTNWKNE